MLPDLSDPYPLDDRIQGSWEQQIDGTEQVLDILRHSLGYSENDRSGETREVDGEDDQWEWEPHVCKALVRAPPGDIQKTA